MGDAIAIFLYFRLFREATPIDRNLMQTSPLPAQGRWGGTALRVQRDRPQTRFSSEVSGLRGRRLRWRWPDISGVKPGRGVRCQAFSLRS